MPHADETHDARRALAALAAERRGGATFCPSEAARRLGPDWRGRMGLVRAAAAALVDEGRLVALQSGRPVDPRSARGPIRLRAPAS